MIDDDPRHASRPFRVGSGIFGGSGIGPGLGSEDPPARVGPSRLWTRGPVEDERRIHNFSRRGGGGQVPEGTQSLEDSRKWSSHFTGGPDLDQKTRFFVFFWGLLDKLNYLVLKLKEPVENQVPSSLVQGS